VRGGKPFLPPADGVSAWDGVNYTTLGTADGPVNALAIYNGDIIAAGAFTSMDGVATPGVARRNSATGVWTAMGAGFPLGVPYALAVYNGALYLGGTTMLSPMADYGRLQMWNGASWVAPFGGLDGPVYALAATDDYLEIGGDFQGTGFGVISPYWMRYINVGVAVEPEGAARRLQLAECKPNPSQGAALIEFSLASPGPAHLQILDVAGRRVRGLVNGWLASGPHEATWNGVADDGRAVASGVYFELLESQGKSAVRRLVWMR